MNDMLPRSAILFVLACASCGGQPVTTPPSTTSPALINMELLQAGSTTYRWCGNVYSPPPTLADCAQVLAWFNSNVRAPVYAQNNPVWQTNACFCPFGQTTDYAGPATCAVWGNNEGWNITQQGTCTP